MKRDQLIETMARATRADLYEEASAPENASPTMQEYYRVIIERHELLLANALTALEAKGMVVVPREPTEEMLRPGNPPYHFRPSEMRELWSAMLSTSPTRTEGK